MIKVLRSVINESNYFQSILIQVAELFPRTVLFSTLTRAASMPSLDLDQHLSSSLKKKSCWESGKWHFVFILIFADYWEKSCFSCLLTACTLASEFSNPIFSLVLGREVSFHFSGSFVCSSYSHLSPSHFPLVPGTFII